MKNKSYSKFFISFFTILSLVSLGFFNYYMSNYYNNRFNAVIYNINPAILFFIILIIILIQVILVHKFTKNK